MDFHHNTKDMKNSRFLIVLLVLVIVFITGNCKKDNSTQPKVNMIDTISSDLQTDSGSVGLILNTRPIAKKGYHPDHLQVNIQGDLSGFSRSLAVDPKTYVTVLKYYVDSLTDTEVSSFENGVGLDIKVYDASQKLLGELSLDNQIVDASDYSLEIDSDLPAINPPARLNADLPFIVQCQNDGKVISIPQYNSVSPGHVPVGTSDYTLQNNQNELYYFRHVQGEADSVYCMTSYRGYLMDFDMFGDFYESAATYDAGNVPDKLKMIVSPDSSGWVRIRFKTGGNLLWTEPDFGLINLVRSESSSSLFRLLNGDIVWSITDMGTDFEQPVLPAAKLEFAYKATLRNCSPATLSETVGRSESRTQSFTSGTEESLELFSSSEYSAEVTAGVDVDATFFGAGATYSLEATAGYTYTTSTTQTTSNYWEATNSTEVVISRERTIEIGPETAIEVYDAVQTLNNVRMPFTKRFRLKGTYGNGNPLSGDEINFQLFSNRFGGVVSQVGSDFVDFTLKGVTTIDQMLDVETRTTEIKGGCSGG